MPNDPQFRFIPPERRFLTKKTTYGPVDKDMNSPWHGSGTWIFPIFFKVTARRVFAVPGITDSNSDWGVSIFKAEDVHPSGIPKSSGAEAVADFYNGLPVHLVTLAPGDYVCLVVNWDGLDTDQPTLTLPDIEQSLTLKQGRLVAFPGVDVLYDKFGTALGLVTAKGLGLLGSLSVGGVAKADGKDSFAFANGEAKGDKSFASGTSVAVGNWSSARGIGAVARDQNVDVHGGYNMRYPSSPGGNQTVVVQWGTQNTGSGPAGGALTTLGSDRAIFIEGTVVARSGDKTKSKVLRVRTRVKVDAAGSATIIDPVIETVSADAGTEGWGFSFYTFNYAGLIGVMTNSEADATWGGQLKITEVY